MAGGTDPPSRAQAFGPFLPRQPRSQATMVSNTIHPPAPHRRSPPEESSGPWRGAVLRHPVRYLAEVGLSPRDFRRMLYRLPTVWTLGLDNVRASVGWWAHPPPRGAGMSPVAVQKMVVRYPRVLAFSRAQRTVPYTLVAQAAVRARGGGSRPRPRSNCPGTLAHSICEADGGTLSPSHGLRPWTRGTSPLGGLPHRYPRGSPL